MSMIRLTVARSAIGLMSTVVTTCFVSTASAQTVQLETINVEGAQDRAVGQTSGYVAPRTVAGSKSDTPIAEIPQSISVITREQIDDRSVQSLNEALSYTAGVSTSMYGFDPRYDSFFLRGFDMTYTGIFRDGLRELNGNLSIYRDEPYGLERITVLRGPSSTLYSQSSPGGLVDLQTKRPTEAPFREIEIQSGSHNRYQGNFDISGPADKDGRLLYRLTGLYRQSNTAMPFVPDNRLYLAPAFTYNVSKDTKFTMLTEYSESVYAGSAAYYYNGINLTDLPYSDPNYNKSIQKQGRIGYEFEHRFSDALKFRQNFRYSQIDVNYRYVGISSITGTTASRYKQHYLENVDAVTVDNQAEAKFTTGPVSHTLVAGADYAFADWDRRNSGYDAAPDLDIVSRNYGSSFIGDGPMTQASGLRQSQFGVYANEQARFDKFILTLGGRYDWLNRAYFSQTSTTDLSGNRDDEKFSGRVGLSYLAGFGLTPYISYSTSFAPTLIVAAPLAGGEPFAPTTAQGKEIGVKFEPPGMRALFTLAAFDITQQNTAVYNSATFEYEQIGETRSRGFEFDGVAEFGKGFRANVAYTYLDMEVLRGTATEIGHFPSGIPRHQASAWMNYIVPEGPLVGFGGGLGLRYIGVSYGDNANTFTNPDALLVDGTLRYDLAGLSPQLKGTELKVNETNLTGQQYTTCKDSWCYRTEERRVIASLRYRW